MVLALTLTMMIFVSFLIVVSMVLFESVLHLEDIRYYATFYVANLPFITCLTAFFMFAIIISTRFKRINELFYQMSGKSSISFIDASTATTMPLIAVNYDEIVATYRKPYCTPNTKENISIETSDDRSVIRKMIDYFTKCKVSAGHQ